MLNLTTKTENLAVVALAGRLDSPSVPPLETELEHLVRDGHRFIVLDFGAVTFLASAGLRLLLQINKLCRQNDGALALAAVPPPIQTVLDLAGFAPHFKVFPSAAAAEAALKA